MKRITKIVAYYRLSKPKKGKNKQETIRDAYGLEAQRQAVHRLAEEHGAKIIGEFREIETGRRADRPELRKAVLMAQMHKATLVIGK
jgi:DNA invertase Pin-like site-specific DNA recombinase